MPTRYSVILTKGSVVIDDDAQRLLLTAIDDGRRFVTLPLDVVGDAQSSCEGLVNLQHIISVLPIASGDESPSMPAPHVVQLHDRAAYDVGTQSEDIDTSDALHAIAERTDVHSPMADVAAISAAHEQKARTSILEQLFLKGLLRIRNRPSGD